MRREMPDDLPLLDAAEVLKVLSRHRVRYILIGALAATVHGSPLRTEDVDICPAKDNDNLDRLATALEELDALEWEPHKGEAVTRRWDATLLASDDAWMLSTKNRNPCPASRVTPVPTLSTIVVDHGRFVGWNRWQFRSSRRPASRRWNVCARRAGRCW